MQVVQNVEDVIAIEIMCACQALEHVSTLPPLLALCNGGQSDGVCLITATLGRHSGDQAHHVKKITFNAVCIILLLHEGISALCKRPSLWSGCTL